MKKRKYDIDTLKVVYVDYYGGMYHAVFTNSDGNIKKSGSERRTIIQWVKRILTEYHVKIVFAEGCPNFGHIYI